MTETSREYIPGQVMASQEEERQTVEFSGIRFAIADRIGLMPLMRFAKIAKSDVEADDMEGLAAMYDLLHQCLADDEWDRFEAHADRSRAGAEELMKVVQETIAVIASRPTTPPSTSSGGRPSTNVSSAAESGSVVDSVIRLEKEGRPDLALIVEQARRYRATN